MLWANVFHRNGSEGACGVTGLNLTGLLALPLNTLSFLWRKRSHFPKPSPWSRVPVSVFLALLPIALFPSRARSKERRCLCRAVRERLAHALFNWRTVWAQGSSPLAVPKATLRPLLGR